MNNSLVVSSALDNNTLIQLCLSQLDGHNRSVVGGVLRHAQVRKVVIVNALVLWLVTDLANVS